MKQTIEVDDYGTITVEENGKRVTITFQPGWCTGGASQWEIPRDVLEAISPLFIQKKPTLPDVLPIVKAYYAKPGNNVGGNFHIVLEDGNTSDEDIKRCIERARQAKDVDGVRLGETLLRMTQTQRQKLYRAEKD